MRLYLVSTPRHKITFTLVFTTILVAAVVALIAWPSITTIKGLANQIYEQRVELEKLYTRGQVLKQTLKEYEEIKPAIPTLNRVYLTRGNELDFITTLETTATSVGVTHDIKLTTSDPKKSTNQLQYQLQTQSDLPSFIRYLAALEALNFYININTIRLSTGAGDSQRANASTTPGNALQAILLATSYFKP
ncbi:MAG: hypothetical protein Q8P77_02775 [Candidatus Veblenbacteria bacterium]|nr:hypothetical protein [Candidatus Veblenbacteria bacterium]